MNDEDRAVVLEFYAASRAEVVQRLSLREQVLLASIAADGVVAGIAFKGTWFNTDILLLIPWLSLVVTMAFGRHDFVIRQLGTYVGKKLRAKWASTGLIDFDGWLRTPEVTNRITYLVIERILFTLMTCGPSIAVLFIAYPGTLNFPRYYAASVLAVLATLGYFVYEVVRVCKK